MTNEQQAVYLLQLKERLERIINNLKANLPESCIVTAPNNSVAVNFGASETIDTYPILDDLKKLYVDLGTEYRVLLGEKPTTTTVSRMMIK